VDRKVGISGRRPVDYRMPRHDSTTVVLVAPAHLGPRVSLRTCLRRADTVLRRTTALAVGLFADASGGGPGISRMPGDVPSDLESLSVAVGRPACFT